MRTYTIRQVCIKLKELKVNTKVVDPCYLQTNHELPLSTTTLLAKPTDLFETRMLTEVWIGPATVLKGTSALKHIPIRTNN